VSLDRQFFLNCSADLGLVLQEVCLICGADITQFEDVVVVSSAPVFLTEDVAIPRFIGVLYGTCSGCGVKVQSPRLSDESIALYYSTGAYRKFLMVSRTPNEREKVEGWRSMYVATKLLSKSPNNRTHLDFGGDSGLLCRMMVGEGDYASILIELNDESRKYAETFHKIPAFAEMPQKELKFGAISAIEVLEHLGNPVEVLSDLYSRLEDGGTLIATVPLDDPEWAHHYSIHHIHVFTENSLLELAKQAGITESPEIDAVETSLVLSVTRRKL